MGTYSQLRKLNKPKPKKKRKSGLTDIPLNSGVTKKRSPGLEKKGGSSTAKLVPKNRSKLTELQTSEVSNSVSYRVPKSVSSEVRELQTYRVPNYDRLSRIEARFTREQKRFLDDLEEDIRFARPELERNDPEKRRITKAAILRAFVELFRQLELTLEPEKYTNENSLVEDLFEKLSSKVTELQTYRVPK